VQVNMRDLYRSYLVLGHSLHWSSLCCCLRNGLHEPVWRCLDKWCSIHYHAYSRSLYKMKCAWDIFTLPWYIKCTYRTHHLHIDQRL
jgi:hypothetical protein